MNINELSIPGCFEIIPPCFEDERGIFVKTFHDEIYKATGIEFIAREEFYSLSHKNVLRGMHFQLPPAAHNKIVYCLAGEVTDFIVDLRVNSATYGKNLTISLSAANKKIIYLPIGIAHGFLALTPHTLMMYKTDHVYSPDNDSGILWSSCGFKQTSGLIISKKDNSFMSLDQFKSPFL